MRIGRELEKTYLLVPLLLLAILLATAALRAPHLVSLSGLGSAIIVAAPLVMATYALMALAVAGRGTIDLAIGPLVAFINVVVVKLNGMELVTGPIGVFAVALGIGVIYQVAFAAAVIFVRVQPIIVALSGFLALSGINLVILPRPGGTAPDWMAEWGLGSTIFSPILLMILAATGGWLLFTLTPLHRHLRMMRYDERAAYTSGVRIGIVRTAAHVIAGLFVGLAAICYTALIASGDPTQGSTLTLTAITAMVLGGVSLAGGRGGVTGALLGALNLFLIGYVLATFDFGAVQAFVTQLAYGLILVASLLLTLLVPLVGRHLAFISPFAAFVVLGTVVATIMLHVATAETFAPAGGELAAAPAADLATRYFLLPVSSPSAVLELSRLQKAAFGAASVLVLLVMTFRLAVAEAISGRAGAFLHVSIGIAILLGLLAVGMSGGEHLNAVAVPR